jgi:uncharacterized membrane protein YqhA
MERKSGDAPNAPLEQRRFGQKQLEFALWGSRVFVLIPVVASLLIAIAMFYAATVDTIQNLLNLQRYAIPSPLPEVHERLRSDLISHVVEAIDGYLLGIVMLIFSMGLYELFLARILPAISSERAKGILVVHSLDDLKARLGQVILLMLIVKFFERALALFYQSASDLLILAIGILLVSLSLHITHMKNQAE